MLFPIITYPGSGTGAGNGVTVESTGIMTEVVGRDSPHRGMTWVPNRNAWEETGEIRSNTFTWSLQLVSAVAQYCLSWQGWPWRRSLPWGIWLGLWWWRRAQLWPSAALGPPWLASHAASSRHPHSGKVRDGIRVERVLHFKGFLKATSYAAPPETPSQLIFLPLGSATSMTWIWARPLP